MKRILLAAAAALALLPGAVGLLGNDSFAGSVPARVPAGAQPVTSVDLSPAPVPAVPLAQPMELGDDHGGERAKSTPEPGDDHGGRSGSTSGSAGSGSAGSGTAGPRSTDDATSGHSGPGRDAGKDHGVDDHGSDDHGSDDHGEDDH